MSTLSAIDRRLKLLAERSRLVVRESSLSRYAADPVAYAREHLGQRWWSKQAEIARAVVEHGRVFVRASHGVGKTHLAGGLVNWHFDCFSPGLTLTTAPTSDQVRKLTWKEVRLQRRGTGLLPRAPELRGANEGHFAAGYTARDEHSFQGQHSEHLLVIFEEATGIEEMFWIAADGMLSSGPGNRFLAIYNPVDVSSIAYQRETAGDSHVIQVSALEHPNIEAELRGLPRPFPHAVGLSWIRDKLETWCTPIAATEATALDFCFPPEPIARELGIEPKWYRPGPHFESKVLGRWPSQATNAVWPLALIEACLSGELNGRVPGLLTIPEVGCDPARFGDDFTSIHWKDDHQSQGHETHNGWSTSQTAGRLKQLCREIAVYVRRKNPSLTIAPEDIPVKVDCGGGDVGTGVIDQAGEFSFIAVSSSDRSSNVDYHNRRSELWFNAVHLARRGGICLSMLDRRTKAELKKQALMPVWKISSAGASQVEQKEKTKERLGRSPDDMDAVNLAYLPAVLFDSPGKITTKRREMFGRSRDAGTVGVFGGR